MSDKAEQKDFSQEDRSNLVEFFDLLLKIDMRENPELYRSKKEAND